MQNKLPLINSAHGSETRNIINEIIKAINDRGLEILSESGFLTWLEKNGIKHREEVATFADLPANDSLNTVRGVADENKIYIKKESGWVSFQSIDINKINEVDSRLSEDLKSRGISTVSLGVIGDGVTDDSDAFENALNDPSIKSLVISGDVRISRNITVQNKSDLEITFIGESKIVADSCDGPQFINCQNLKINNYSAIYSSRDWIKGHSGLIIKDSSNTKGTISRVRGFRSGVLLWGKNGGVSYSTLNFNQMHNNQYDIHILSEDGGWVTEVDIYGGRFYLSSEVHSAHSGTWAVYGENKGTHSSNNIRLYSPSFEFKENAIKGAGVEWLIFHPRFERIEKVWIEGNLSRSLIVVGYGGFDRSKMNFNSASRNISVVGKMPDGESSFQSIGGQFSGYSILNKNDLSSLGEIKYIGRRNSVGLTDAKGIEQPFNKQYESSEAPTSGTYNVGSIVWNLTPNRGEPMGWMCSSTGTFGSLSNTTLSITSGSRDGIINNPSTIKVGDSLSVGGSRLVVDELKGQSIRFTTASSITLSNSKIDYLEPVFVEMPKIP